MGLKIFRDQIKADTNVDRYNISKILRELGKEVLMEEAPRRKVFPLQVFRVGERVVDKDEAIRGRRIVRVIEKVFPNWWIQFPKDDKVYHPNKFERA